MIHRADLLVAVKTAVQQAAIQVGWPNATLFADREVPINSNMLPALNIKRMSDVTVPAGEFPSVLRQLNLAVDLYHSGELRFATLDECELAIRAALEGQIEPLDYVQKIEADTNWDLEDLAEAFVATRLQITIEYERGAA